MIIIKKIYFILIISWLILFSDAKIFLYGLIAEENLYTNAIIDKSLSITSISDNAVLPSNIKSLKIEWSGDLNYKHILNIRSMKGSIFIPASSTSILAEGKQFTDIIDNEVIFQLFKKAEKLYASREIHVFISKYPLNDQVVFRTVEPLFDPAKTGIVNILDIPTGRTRNLFTAQNTCTGCHAFSGKISVHNNRKGTDRRLILNSTNKKSGLKELLNGNFSYVAISPDNKSIAVVVNTTSKIRLTKNYIEPFHMLYETGDIAIIDVETGKLSMLEGASDPGYVEDMPKFSPDGEKIYFSKYKTTKLMNSIEIMEIPAKGGKAGTIINAKYGEFFFLPNPSPDGKWITYVSADASRGIFARKSSDICIYDILTGKSRKLKINSEGMDSWHSWSSDGRWIIFSSNREQNGITSLYLSAFDENGMEHAPVKVLGYSDLKINMPVFTSGWDKQENKNLNKDIFP